MSKIEVDLIIDITFNVETDGTAIKTNVKKEAIEDMLADWLYRQMGSGQDDSKANQLDIYNIKIGYSLDEDAFGSESNTGNKGLTCGIVQRVLSNLDKAEVLPLH